MSHKSKSTGNQKGWILELIKRAEERNGNNLESQFWQQDTPPILLITNEIIDQLLDYINNYPIEPGLGIYP